MMGLVTNFARAVVSAVALHDARSAHRIIGVHTGSDAAGRCRACLEFEPCRQRTLAHMALLGHGELPRRRPGAALPAVASVGSSHR